MGGYLSASPPRKALGGSIMSAARTNIRLQAIVVVMGAVLMAIKFTAWWLTHSNTILSDALESIVNVTAGSLALYSLWLAAKPRDREHPYGHGKVEFISAGVEGGLVVLAGGLIIWRAVMALLHEQHVHDLATGIVLAAFAGGTNLVMGILLRNKGRASHSIAMEAGGTHLLSDAWSTVAMVLGLVVIQVTGLLWLDQVFAIAFACFIIYQGLGVFRRSISGIMDETDMDLAAEVIAILENNRRTAWIDIHNFRMIKYGSVLHIDSHVTLPWYYKLEEAHAEITAIEHLVNVQWGRETELFIHMDPCVETSCAVCLLSECAVRKHAFQRRVPWTLETALMNKKHEGT